MASLRLVKRRIKSAKNISQVTKALQMVSAVKMRKAQEAALAGKPYAGMMKSVLNSLSGKVEKDLHPFLSAPGVVKKAMVVVIATEKGLAGSLVTNLARKSWSVKDHIEKGKLVLDQADDGIEILFDSEVEIKGVSFGKKAREILKKTGWPIVADFTTKTKEPLEDIISALNSLLSKAYLTKEVDTVLIVYSNFINTMTQKPEVIQFLPMTSSHLVTNGNNNSHTIVKFEPSPVEVLDSLLEHYLEVILAQIVIDGQAAEHSARMVAMKSANENANDVIKDLTITYNQSRQAMITNEIADIVSGSLSAV